MSNPKDLKPRFLRSQEVKNLLIFLVKNVDGDKDFFEYKSLTAVVSENINNININSQKHDVKIRQVTHAHGV